jgi:hypothetical protein
MQSRPNIVDRGLCIVLTLMTGAALFTAEACSGNDTERPPVTEKLGNQPELSQGAGSSPTGDSQTGGGSGGGTGGDNGGTVDPNPISTTTPTQPGQNANGTGTTTGGLPTTTPTQPVLDGG